MSFVIPFDTHKIRITDEKQPKASAIDVISFVTGKDSNHSAIAMKRLYESYPEVTSIVSNFKFPGKGQRDTPVADARGIWKIITLLPGKAAATFRDKSGDVMIRFLGGDESLIAEIRGNRELQETLAVTNPDHPLRFIGKTVEGETSNNLSTQRAQLELEDMKTRIEERKLLNLDLSLTLKRKQFELLNQVSSSFANDDRDIMYLNDAKRTCLHQIVRINEPIGETPLVQPPRELTISDVAKSLHKPYTDNKVLAMYGRACAQLYRDEHEGNNPIKRTQSIGGVMRSVNCYFEDDRDLLIRGITSVE